jgi:hypothetical protein
LGNAILIPFNKKARTQIAIRAGWKTCGSG